VSGTVRDETPEGVDRCGRLLVVYDDIRYEVDDPVAVITLSRPQALNAWTEQMDLEVRDALMRAAADPKVVGIVVTGEGRAFCAGADMNLLSGISSGSSEHAMTRPGARAAWARDDGSDDFAGRFPYVMAIDKPVIAAINGAVAGMAFPFALCCDIRIVSPDALFVTAFVQRGLIAEWGLSWLLPRLVGPAVALDLLYTSRRVNGEEAYRLGLANYLVERDELMSFSRSYVEQLARGSSPTSMAIMKRQVYEQLHRGLGEAEYDSQRLILESFKRGDFKEGVTSFLEKRPPDFPRLPLGAE
jgi:enoyl-CoA hydratase/carnithine racemase